MRKNEKADEVFTTTIEAWIERLPELCQGYEPKNLLNQDILGLFFKALLKQELTEKKKKRKLKAEKKLKQRMTAMSIVAADSSFVF